MDIIKRIELMLGEMDGGTVGTTTSDVEKVPQGTKKSYKKKDEEEEDEEEEELERKKKQSTEVMGEL